MAFEGANGTGLDFGFLEDGEFLNAFGIDGAGELVRIFDAF